MTPPHSTVAPEGRSSPSGTEADRLMDTVSVAVWMYTFSALCAVPKKMGPNANHTTQVVYIAKPMGLASLKVSGTPRAFTAYTVQVSMSSRA